YSGSAELFLLIAAIVPRFARLQCPHKRKEVTLHKPLASGALKFF
ncbi:uncharacterized protein METZ01_LOCUS243347, partial [marine metagenome]